MRRPNATEAQIHEAAQLLAAGHSTRQVGPAIGVHDSTISRWSQRSDVQQLIKEGRAEIAARYVQLMRKRLDALEDGSLVLASNQLPIDYGIAQDKYDRMDAPPPAHTGPFYIFTELTQIVAPPPPTTPAPEPDTFDP